MYNKFMNKRKIPQNTKLQIYLDIRDDISMLLGSIGDICEKHGLSKKYEKIHDEIASKLVAIDHLIRDEIIYVQKQDTTIWKNL